MKKKLQSKKVIEKGWAIIIKDKYRMADKLVMPDIFTKRRMAIRRMEMNEYHKANNIYKVIPVEIHYFLPTNNTKR